MTRTEHDDDRLPEPAEAWLKGWPAPSRSSLEWEDAASATMARVRDVQLGSTPDDLLVAPLPEAEGERTFELDLPADEPSLADIARRVVESGAVLPNDLAREGLLAAAQSRTERPLVDAAPRSGVPPPRSGAGGLAAEAKSPGPHAPLPAAARPLSAIHVASARSELPHSEMPHSEPAQSQSVRHGLAGIYLGGAALAVAAAALVIVLVRQPELAAPPSLASAEHDPRRGAATAAPAPQAAAEPEAPAAVRLDDLAKAEPETGKEAAAARRAAPAQLPSTKEASNAAPADSLAFRVQPSPKSKVVLSSREGDESPDEAEAQTQAGPPPPSPAQAAAPAGEVPAAAPKEELLPERPSVGAIQAAVGSVMMGARSCLAGQEQGSQAQLTFGPNGRVRSVVVSGPAAGTPAESCLRSALSAARVAPFSEPSFTASLTVRPP